METQQTRTAKRSSLLAAGLLLGVAVAAWSQRTAQVQKTRVMQTEGAQPVAEVALSYTRGPRPASVVVEVRGQHGAGSATVDGDEDLIVVPLTGLLGDTYTVEVIASSRVLGRLRTVRQSFLGRIQEPEQQNSGARSQEPE